MCWNCEPHLVPDPYQEREDRRGLGLLPEQQPGEGWHEHECRRCGATFGCTDGPSCSPVWRVGECKFCPEAEAEEPSDKQREGRF